MKFSYCNSGWLFHSNQFLWFWCTALSVPVLMLFSWHVTLRERSAALRLQHARSTFFHMLPIAGVLFFWAFYIASRGVLGFACCSVFGLM